MDGSCSYEELRSCLQDLEVVNRAAGAYNLTLSWLERLVEARVTKYGKILILDVGCGYGDTLRAVERWARRRNIAVELIGLDLNEHAIRAAREATSAWSGIRFLVSDAFALSPSIRPDVVINSLLVHHLDDAEVVCFLRFLEERSQLGWFVQDLQRHRIPYFAFRYWACGRRWHPFVQHDGPLSFRRAFTLTEWKRLIEASGLRSDQVSLEWHLFRLCVGRVKAGGTLGEWQPGKAV